MGLSCAQVKQLARDCQAFTVSVEGDPAHLLLRHWPKQAPFQDCYRHPKAGRAVYHWKRLHRHSSALSTPCLSARFLTLARYASADVPMESKRAASPCTQHFLHLSQALQQLLQLAFAPASCPMPYGVGFGHPVRLSQHERHNFWP